MVFANSRAWRGLTPYTFGKSDYTDMFREDGEFSQQTGNGLRGDQRINGDLLAKNLRGARRCTTTSKHTPPEEISSGQYSRCRPRRCRPGASVTTTMTAAETENGRLARKSSKHALGRRSANLVSRNGVGEVALCFRVRHRLPRIRHLRLTSPHLLARAGFLLLALPDLGLGGSFLFLGLLLGFGFQFRLRRPIHRCRYFASRDRTPGRRCVPLSGRIPNRNEIISTNPACEE